jgi:hypothetical protein
VDDRLINKTLDALERLMRMFAAERILYLLCSVVGFVLLIVVLALLIMNKALGVPELAMVFGASGLIGVSAVRVSFFLNKSFDLISAIVKSLMTAQETP